MTALTIRRHVREFVRSGREKQDVEKLGKRVSFMVISFRSVD
jgi:hypothetical protein